MALYEYIPWKLGGIGRFQVTGNNNIFRYIIGDIKSIIFIISLISGKLRTPKNKRLNYLIKFINYKYCLKIQQSALDSFDLKKNRWISFTGFPETDGQFDIKVKPK